MMKKEERSKKIELYGNAPEILSKAIQTLPKDMWQFRPNPDSWTVHEIIIHLADSEANSYIRCRRCIAESGSSVMAYNETEWARALGYHSQDPLGAIELFKWLRSQTHSLIRTLPDSSWANTIYHPENGIMTLEDWLAVYARHIPDHVEQMMSILAAWEAKR